ncbi:DUF883 family protein [Methylophilus sp. VKM B-3414]|uniref:DUF883 family protein n=1 Tax=Methylophilus sp. VKM B-3414 TaxID=3076121 RepID=UPI0028C54E2D|nr:DUF883 family protein [Methylophilus sp. VKM B-3414]MDT7849682.1 DUF883 family protein [Methylophilus sp. VKM B-3414]
MNIRLEQSPHINNGEDAARVLSQDVHAVIADVQALLQETASQGGEALDEIRRRVSQSMETAKQSLQDSEARVIEGSKAAIKATDQYVHLHPWQIAGIAVAIGFGLGWAVKR